VLVFEMWIAEVDQTHLWTVRRGTFGVSRWIGLARRGAEALLDGRVAEQAERKGARDLRPALRPGEAHRSEARAEDSEDDGRRLGAQAARVPNPDSCPHAPGPNGQATVFGWPAFAQQSAPLASW
jgi:hypothetical protein